MREEEDDPKDIAAANALIDEVREGPVIAVDLNENGHEETIRIIDRLAERLPPTQRIGIIGHTSASKRELGLLLAGLDLHRRVEIVDPTLAVKRIPILEEPSTEHPKLDLAQLARRFEYHDRIQMPHYTAGIGDNRGEKRARKAERPRWRR